MLKINFKSCQAPQQKMIANHTMIIHLRTARRVSDAITAIIAAIITIHRIVFNILPLPFSMFGLIFSDIGNPFIPILYTILGISANFLLNSYLILYLIYHTSYTLLLYFFLLYYDYIHNHSKKHSFF